MVKENIVVLNSNELWNNSKKEKYSDETQYRSKRQVLNSEKNVLSKITNNNILT